MKIAITGSSGFIGRHLTNYAAAQGDSINFIKLREGLPKHLDVDTIYHLGDNLKPTSYRDVQQSINNYLEMRCKWPEVPIVFASTSSHDYTSLYNQQKSAVESLWPDRTVYLPTVFGPGDPSDRCIPSMIKQGWQKKTVTSYDSGERVFTYIDDAVHTIYHASKRFTFPPGWKMTIPEMGQKIADLMDWMHILELTHTSASNGYKRPKEPSLPLNKALLETIYSMQNGS